MKKILALSIALSLTFSTTVCAETIVPEQDFSRIDTLSKEADKSITEFVSNAVSEMDSVRDLPAVASGSNMVTEGKETNATCTVDKVSYNVIKYAQHKAEEVGREMLAVVELSAPGVNLVDAQVAITIEGINAGDDISVFKCVKGEWEAVDVVSVTDETVTIKFDTSKGIYTFIK